MDKASWGQAGEQQKVGKIRLWWLFEIRYIFNHISTSLKEWCHFCIIINNKYYYLDFIEHITTAVLKLNLDCGDCLNQSI